MPVTTGSRYEQSLNSPSMYTTPSRSSHIRNAPSTSYSPTVTGNGQQKLNVVTRIAIEGKAKQGQDGASIRMFLKICLPLDLVIPGSTIPLFPEENVKIHSSQVHPLDQNSVPYNFSPTVSPLLHNAARALNLPARSQENFASAFNLARSDGTNGHASTSRSFKSESGESIPPIDVQYTGHIIVSGYSISFVLPKVFFSQRSGGASSDNEEQLNSRTHAHRRRASIGEKNQAHFMAAVDMWVPFISKPPRSPYLLSIPTPRCLHNQIKLRIFPPANAATSFASLSSIEDDGWDLTSDPHVTRSVSKRSSRAHSYTQFADDESSDTSTTASSEGCMVQGTFPSAEHIRIRWARPMKNLNIAGEESGRRRVGVESAKGEMTCIVRGKGISAINPEVEGVLLHVEYKGQCKGVWFPGVATLLGLDVGLEAKGSDICWPRGYPTQWEVSGGAGYTGFGNGSATTPAFSSRTSSMDSNGPRIQITSAKNNESAPFLTSRTNSNASSTASLLRAPLPTQNVAECSFEGSQVTLPSSSETLSSMSSLPTTSTTGLPQMPEARQPGLPITLHLNMNELQPAVKNVFTFQISGTILVTAKATLARINNTLNSSQGSDKPGDPEPIVLPRFTVLAADLETTSIIIRHEADSASVEVFRPTGDIYNDPQTRKTVLQKGGITKCGEDGGRIALKALDAYNMATNGHTRHSRPRTPSASHRALTNSSMPRGSVPPRSKQANPTLIPWVKATVTALAPDANMFPTGYAVHLCLQTPTLDSDWLEFGMGCGPKSNSTDTSAENKQRVHIICATLDGVPVRADTAKATKSEPVGMAAGVPFESLGEKDWICWGKVWTGGSPGSNMAIDYIVKQDNAKPSNSHTKSPNLMEMNIVLPTFFISVARLEVKIDIMPGLEVLSLNSNFDYHHAYPKGNRLLQYSLDESSRPQLMLMLGKITTKSDLHFAGLKSYFILTWIVLLIVLGFLFRTLPDVPERRPVYDGDLCSPQANTWGTNIPTITVTTTIHSTETHTVSLRSPSTTVLALTTSWTISDAHIDATTVSHSSSSVSAHAALHTQSTTEKISSHDTQTTQELGRPNSHQHSILERYGLIPVDKLFSFDWSNAQVTHDFKRTLGRVVESVEVIWNVLRKVYHYPLDPP